MEVAAGEVLAKGWRRRRRLWRGIAVHVHVDVKAAAAVVDPVVCAARGRLNTRGTEAAEWQARCARRQVSSVWAEVATRAPGPSLSRKLEAYPAAAVVVAGKRATQRACEVMLREPRLIAIVAGGIAGHCAERRKCSQSSTMPGGGAGGDEASSASIPKPEMALRRLWLAPPVALATIVLGYRAKCCGSSTLAIHERKERDE